MAPPVVDPYAVATDVLDAVVGYWTSDPGVTLPDRRYVAAWTPAHDCEQVTVQVERIWPHEGGLVEGQFNRRATVGFRVRAMTVGISIVRCAAVGDGRGNPPTVEALDEDAATVLDDYRRVCRAVQEAVDAGDIGSCNGAAFVEWTPIEPTDMIGGTTRWNLDLTG